MKRPKFRFNTYASVYVTDEGNMFLYVPKDCQELEPQEALELAEWIIDTFSKKEPARENI